MCTISDILEILAGDAYLKVMFLRKKPLHNSVRESY
ncbi:MAG: hypothetical protein SRB1_01208 [Desulfobacteraceae bacterium Eth-SRB1]|nr:MAG: hypothetical protein SRB1_01208 [Desulfobacteraceae bacterium Eth-SRB1]